MRRLGIVCGVLALAGCYGGSQPDDFGDALENPGPGGSGQNGNGSAGEDEDDGEDDGNDDGDDGEPTVTPLSPAEIDFYLRKLAPSVVGRTLTYEERDTIAQDGPDSVAPLLAAWVTEPGFAASMRDMMETLLAVSGAREGIDFELPGNLVAQVVGEDLPWSTILTADYCVDAGGLHGECDTGAPYESGVLSTRAYLIANKGRFNLSRASRLMSVFACRIYPMKEDLQPRLDKETLIPMFQAQSPDEQTVDEAAGGFGNGFACYTCHSQFGAHAQLFVKYDGDGLYREEATGLQNPDDEVGRSYDGLYTSHFDDPAAATLEATQFFGEEVGTMREAADVLSQNPVFYECTTKNLLATAFGLETGASEEIEAELVEGLAETVLADDPEPTMAQIVQTVFNDETVIRAVVGATKEGA
jgi:hypothetical protein